MSKISIEHVAEDKRKVKDDDVSKGATDVAEACMSVKKQLEAIQAENGMLRKAVDELRGSIPVTPAGGQVSAAPPREADVSSKGVRREVRHLEGSGRPAPATGPKKEDMTEELKKALMGAASGSRYHGNGSNTGYKVQGPASVILGECSNVVQQDIGWGQRVYPKLNSEAHLDSPLRPLERSFEAKQFCRGAVAIQSEESGSLGLTF
ncbi:uncharacterized protein A4U43_C05F15260 [Asparagus officinalis]|uniref:Uncharacterized protein n=1 Tax=Asparagus officinalis TaxID=4686 RepID=A0A5P1ES14_ASPOF|nr:uncharacterized protein A4U43_C05F15260 [Asparagus officinalis]